MVLLSRELTKIQGILCTLLRARETWTSTEDCADAAAEEEPILEDIASRLAQAIELASTVEQKCEPPMPDNVCAFIQASRERYLREHAAA